MRPKTPREPSALAKARVAAQKTQRSIAEELGISQPWYSDIEIGKCAPDVKLALRIVAIVGGSLEDYWTADTVEVSR